MKIFLKVLVALLIMAYLVYSDKLDFSKLGVLISEPLMVAGFAAGWSIIIVTLSAIRLQMILQHFQFGIGLKKLYQLTWVGNLFNIMIPGGISGDIVKGYYMKKSNVNSTKTLVAGVLSLDRLIGLSAFIIIAAVGLLVEWNLILNVSPLLALFTLGLFIGVCVFLIFCIFPLKKSYNFKRFRKIKFSNFIFELLEIFRNFGSSPWKIMMALFISITLQMINILLFAWVINALNVDSASLWSVMSVVPIGFLIVSIPIAPAGIGVGHLAFESLFNIIGITGGANIFNVFLSLQILISLFGLIPYFLMDLKSVKEMQIQEEK